MSVFTALENRFLSYRRDCVKLPDATRLSPRSLALLSWEIDDESESFEPKISIILHSQSQSLLLCVI